MKILIFIIIIIIITIISAITLIIISRTIRETIHVKISNVKLLDLLSFRNILLFPILRTERNDHNLGVTLIPFVYDKD
jgi:hypothetical protein